MYFRWYNWHRSLHRIRFRNRCIRSSRCSHRICLRRNPRLQRDDVSRRNGNLHSHPRSLHPLRSTIYRSFTWFCNGMDLLVFMGHNLRTRTHSHRSHNPILGPPTQHRHFHFSLLGSYLRCQSPPSQLFRRNRILVLVD